MEEDSSREIQTQQEEGGFSREITLEQIQEVVRIASTSVDEAASYLAGVLCLEDFRIKARTAFVLDYCLGIIMKYNMARFSQEAGFSFDQTLVLYSLGLNILEIVKRGGEFEEAEEEFKNKMLSLSCKEFGNENPPFASHIDVQKATEYFTSTLFQHYSLYRYCYTKEHCQITKSETVRIETALFTPLTDALITEEYEADLAAKAAAIAAAEAQERERQEAAAKAEAEAFAIAEAARLEEERKRKPQTLEEAVEFVVREKMVQAKRMLEEEYTHREQALLDKMKGME